MKKYYILQSKNNRNIKFVINQKIEYDIKICGNLLYYKNTTIKWTKHNPSIFTKLPTSFEKPHFNIIKEYNTLQEVLIDIPELMLL